MGKKSRLKREKRAQHEPVTHKTNQLTLLERNLTFLEAAADIFGFKREVEWNEVKRGISGDQIRELYKVFASLWPPSMDYTHTLPTPGHGLRALYLGSVNPETIVRNVLRFSLYADEILIFDPFHNPWFMPEDLDPIAKPDQFRDDTLKLLLCLGLLEPWIRSGLVKLIPRVDHQNPTFRNLAAQRLKNYKLDPSDSEELESDIRDGYFRFLATLPRENLVRVIRQSNPGITEMALEDLLEYFSKIRKHDPLALDQSSDETGGQILVSRTGANLETGLYVAHLTGAFPYTNMHLRWKELLSVGKDLPRTAQVWSPLTRAFQELDFKFLDNVDSRFAYSLRTEGRLESFRAFLRRLWNTVGGEPNIDKIETLARDFRDEFVDEYHKAEAEWEKIDRELLLWTGSVGASTLGAAGAATTVIPGGLSLALPLLGFGVTAVLKLVETHSKRRDFRKTIPMSVFIDLSRHKGIRG